MSVADLVDGAAAGSARTDMTALMADLAGICRSITGDGVRDTLARVAKDLPVTVHEVPSGTRALDWTVPPEWNVRDAYIADRDGTRVVDLHASPLHLVGYSVPVRARMTLEDLRPHLHTLPEHPDWVPYRTSYYTPDWGFCLSQRQLDAMDDGPYDVHIDTTLEPGSLTYGECVLAGRSPDEVLLSTHVCHPAMANDNLTGIAVATALGRLLDTTSHRYTYRLLLVPGTIGALTWLSGSAEVLPRVRHGVVLTGLGGPGPLVWKRSRDGHRAVDRAAEHVVRRHDGEVRDYSPWGYDERQFNAPGFDLPVGRLTRTPHGEYPEYHTSADDLSFVSASAMVEALAAVLELLDVLEHDAVPLRRGAPGEPQLGRRGLYPSIGGHSAQQQVMALLWAAGCADGEHSLLDVARRADLAFAAVRRAAADLAGEGLLELRPLS